MTRPPGGRPRRTALAVRRWGFRAPESVQVRVEPGGKPFDVPAEEADASPAGEPVGHATDVANCSVGRVGCAGDLWSFLIEGEVFRMRQVVVNERLQQIDQAGRR